MSSLQSRIKKPFVVSRTSIPELNFVKINSKLYTLGILKDFRKHHKLSEAIPQTGRISLSWVHLEANQSLLPHKHPVSSMIVICSGKVKSLGDVNLVLSEGDIFFVPPNAIHGFTGLGDNGFWGLSIQFENGGLYEDPKHPMVEFVEDPSYA